MSVGLYDVDMALYNQTPLNLELMKYASYYKNKMEIVTMTSMFNPNQYGQFIVRKDYPDGTFPLKMETYDNLIYGGHAFSGDRYVPLDETIERRVPDKSIYEKFRLKFGSTNKLIAAYDVMLRAEHFRFSLDGKTVWEDYERQLDLNSQTRTIFIHDYDINKIDGGRAELERLMKKVEKGCARGFIGMKFPVVVSNYDDLLYWCKFKSTGSFYNVEYRGPMADNELADIIKSEEIRTNPSKIDYIITANYSDENDFLIRGLSQIYYQVLFLRMNRTKILLKYEDNFFVDKRWERLIDLFNCFMAVTINLNITHFKRVINFDSLYSFCRSLEESPRTTKYNVFNKQEARELFVLVKETNYDLFKDFYEKHTVELIGGKFE